VKRYDPIEVAEALRCCVRGIFTPHDQLVLGGEVVALREQAMTAMVCPEHAIIMYIAPGSEKLQCWHCNEGRRLREEVDGLRAALRAATDCPESRNGRCWYRVHTQIELERLRTERVG